MKHTVAALLGLLIGGSSSLVLAQSKPTTADVKKGVVDVINQIPVSPRYTHQYGNTHDVIGAVRVDKVEVGDMLVEGKSALVRAVVYATYTGPAESVSRDVLLERGFPPGTFPQTCVSPFFFDGTWAAACVPGVQKSRHVELRFTKWESGWKSNGLNGFSFTRP